MYAVAKIPSRNRQFRTKTTASAPVPFPSIYILFFRHRNQITIPSPVLIEYADKSAASNQSTFAYVESPYLRPIVNGLR